MSLFHTTDVQYSPLGGQLHSSQILGWAAILQPPAGWRGGQVTLQPPSHRFMTVFTPLNGFPVTLPSPQPTFCLSPPRPVSHILDSRHRRT